MKEQVVRNEISTYFSLLTPEQKASVIDLIKSFLKTDQHKRLTKKQYNKLLEDAEKRVAKGKFIYQEDLERESDKW